MAKAVKTAEEKQAAEDLENSLIEGAGLETEAPALPQMVSEIQKPELPLMVPEDQVMMESDLSKAIADDVPIYHQDPKDLSADDLHAQRLKKYGKDYVVVHRANQQQVFTRVAWNNLQGDKNGWREAVPMPAEVRALRNRQ